MLRARGTGKSARLRDRLPDALCPDLLDRRTASRPRRASRVPPGAACGLGCAEAPRHSCLRRLEIDAERRVELPLPLVHVPGRVGDESRFPEPFIHRIVHVAVDPECGLVSLDQPIQVGGERRVQRIALEPTSDRARARRVVRYHHRSFAGKLRPCELSLDEVPGGPMPSDGLPRAEVPPPVPNRAREIRYAPAQPSVRPNLVGLAVELQIRPQGRPNEAGALDPDGTGVEEVDPDFRALLGESPPSRRRSPCRRTRGCRGRRQCAGRTPRTPRASPQVPPCTARGRRRGQ